MKKPRSILEGNLLQVLEQTELRKFKDKVEDIKAKLLQSHDMKNIQGIFNNPKEKLSQLDDRELLLFAEQVYFKTHHLEEIDIEEFYYPNEINEARQFSASIFKEEQFIEYPILIEHASKLTNDTYSITLDVKVINKLLNSGILYYDPELQRETTKSRRYGIVIEQPTLIKKNVEEIAEHLKEGTLAATTLWLNAMPKTSVSGNELEYDHIKRTIKITQGTKIAIGDGFHRITGIQNALTVKPDIEFNFTITLTNYSKKRAQAVQAQMAKSTPMSEVRVQALEAENFADIVVQTLKEESELKGKIVDKKKATISYGELVSYNVLTDTIKDEFLLRTRAEAEDVGEYLVEIFNNLLGRLPDEFLFKAEEISKKSFINANFAFIGYVVLARRMYENELKPRQIVNIVKQIDFSRTNPIWKEIGLVNERNHISSNYMDNIKLNNKIKDIFEKIKIDGVMVKS